MCWSPPPPSPSALVTTHHRPPQKMENFVHELLQLVGEGEAIAGTPVPLAYSRHTSRLLSVWVSWD